MDKDGFAAEVENVTRNIRKSKSISFLDLEKAKKRREEAKASEDRIQQAIQERRKVKERELSEVFMN